MNELQSQSRPTIVYDKPRRRRHKWKKRLRALSEYSGWIVFLTIGALVIWFLIGFVAG